MNLYQIQKTHTHKLRNNTSWAKKTSWKHRNWSILESHSSISAFDFLIRGVLGDTEHFVRVSPDRLRRRIVLLRFRSVRRHSFFTQNYSSQKTLEMLLLSPQHSKKHKRTTKKKKFWAQGNSGAKKCNSCDFLSFLSEAWGPLGHGLRWERERERLHEPLQARARSERKKETKRTRRDIGGEFYKLAVCVLYIIFEYYIFRPFQYKE